MIENRCGSSQKHCQVDVYLVPDETIPISFVFILYTLQTTDYWLIFVSCHPRLSFGFLKVMLCVRKYRIFRNSAFITKCNITIDSSVMCVNGIGKQVNMKEINL